MLRRALCWTVLVSFVLTIDAGAARADEVGLSLDGQTWTSELRRPLFDPAFRWVPGDTETRSLWVRNQGPTAASMRITLRTTDPDELLARDDLQIDARVQRGAWTSLGNGGTGRTLTDEVLAKGDRIRVDLRVAFIPEATNRTERKHLPLTFVIRLTQDGPGGGNNGPDGPGGELPDTGNVVQPWLLWLAAGLIGSGLALVARRRREESNG